MFNFLLSFRFQFTCLPFIFALLAFLLLVLPNGVKVRGRIIWVGVFLLCAAKFICFRLLGGSAFAVELPEILIWIWNWAYMGLWFLVPLAALGLLLPRRLRRLRLILIPILAWGLSAVGIYNGVKIPAVKEVDYTGDRLPECLNGYRIVQLSDIHISSAAQRWRTEAIVQKVNQLGADLIVVTGDIVDGRVEDQRVNVEPLKNLKAKDGVLFCPGNHEYFSGWADWQTQYRAWGLKFLENEGGCPRPGLYVAGVTDPSGRRRGIPEPDARKAFAAETNGVFRILLQHRPYLASAKSVPVDLQLSGHTHGGIAPGVGFFIRRANGGLLKGLESRSDGSGKVYTSSGTGLWSGFPIRFLNDPEITLITLRRR